MRDKVLYAVRLAATLACLLLLLVVLEGCRRKTNTDYQPPEERPKNSGYSEGS